MITLEDVSKSFGGFRAVQGLSVSIEDGEIFGLVGPNGAGKTTTLRMMTGLLTPDKGRVMLGGHDMAKEPLAAKSILGYIPDRAFLYEKLTAREFLVFTAAIYGITKNTAVRRVEELLLLLGIGDVGDSLIESFSQGMRQRLLFASALIHEPQVLLIDEPFTGLDPFGVKTLKDIITDLGGRGVSVFLATHSLHIAEELCHRIGFINKGTLAAVRQRDEIRQTEGGLEALFLRISG
ncbi:MAG: ABC transporter ATP-binding protein [Nitrospiraceae bacterium]|nr:ABC transporter ATP-binding protein [Nitrospiraceae bacterium]